MAFFNTPVVAALLLSLSFAASSSSAYTSIAASPSPGPAASFDAPYDPLHRFAVPKDEQDQDSQYLKAHMAAAAHQVELFMANEVEKRLSDPTTSGSEKECLMVCKEVYGSAVDALKTGMESVSSGDFMKANFDLSAYTTNIDTCNDCSCEFRKFDDWAKAVGGDCLDKIVKYTNNF